MVVDKMNEKNSWIWGCKQVYLFIYYNVGKIIIFVNVLYFSFINYTISLMAFWNSKQNHFKPIWMITRFFVNCFIYYHIIRDPGFTDELCGPLAIPASPSFLHKVFYFEFANLIWPLLIYLWVIIPEKTRYEGLNKVYFPKALFLILVKLMIICGQEQRLKYYLHVFFIELFILVLTGAIDFIGHPKIAEACQIAIINPLQQIAIFYEITRTFCINFAIYWFVVSLLLLCLSQIQAHYFYFEPLSERMDAVYPGALYVKQDVYRMSIMAFAYFGLYSFLQSSKYGYGMLMAFIVSAVPFVHCIRKIQSGEYRKSLIYLILVFATICGLLWMRVNQPHLFKRYVPKLTEKCGLFDRE